MHIPPDASKWCSVSTSAVGQPSTWCAPIGITPVTCDFGDDLINLWEPMVLFSFVICAATDLQFCIGTDSNPTVRLKGSENADQNWNTRLPYFDLNFSVIKHKHFARQRFQQIIWLFIKKAL
ncbi:hypothetical protein ACTXT7_000359 [Hymenolepis weldensis]